VAAELNEAGVRAELVMLEQRGLTCAMVAARTLRALQEGKDPRRLGVMKEGSKELVWWRSQLQPGCPPLEPQPPPSNHQMLEWLTSIGVRLFSSTLGLVGALLRSSQAQKAPFRGTAVMFLAPDTKATGHFIVVSAVEEEEDDENDGVQSDTEDEVEEKDEVEESGESDVTDADEECEEEEGEEHDEPSSAAVQTELSTPRVLKQTFLSDWCTRAPPPQEETPKSVVLEQRRL